MKTTLLITYEGRELEIRGKVHAPEYDVGVGFPFMDEIDILENGEVLHLPPDEEDKILDCQEFRDALDSMFYRSEED